MIYVAGGTVHTLGPGTVMVETQQQSDTTYRLYDYGRPRPLHLEQGLGAIKERTASGKVIRPAPVAINGGKNRRSSMIAAPYFVVDLFELKAPQDFLTIASESGKMVQGFGADPGRGRRLRSCRGAGRDPVTLAKGDAVVIPAALQGFTVRPQWTIEFLKACVPSGSVPEPATRR